MNNESQKVDVQSFFQDLLYFLDQCDSNDMLAGYEIKQAEDVRDAVVELIDAVTAEYHMAALSRSWPAARQRVKQALARIGATP